MGAAMGGMMGPRWGWGYAPGWGYGGWGHHSHFDSHMHNSTEINNTYVTNETNNITNNYNNDETGAEGDQGTTDPAADAGMSMVHISCMKSKIIGLGLQYEKRVEVKLQFQLYLAQLYGI